MKSAIGKKRRLLNLLRTLDRPQYFGYQIFKLEMELQNADTYTPETSQQENYEEHSPLKTQTKYQVLKG